jgi:hypothetical protein
MCLNTVGLRQREEHRQAPCGVAGLAERSEADYHVLQQPH